MFVDSHNDNFHLTVSSTCIVAVSNNAPNLPENDKDGNPRIMNGIVDMGACEFHGVPSTCLEDALEYLILLLGEGTEGSGKHQELYDSNIPVVTEDSPPDRTGNLLKISTFPVFSITI